ncbi:MAG: ATP-binding protein, partial [Pseudomonadota bacterium]
MGLCLAAWIVSQVQAAPLPPPGKPQINNYLMAEHGGHLNNWVVRQGPDQRIYFGGGDGLVIFDGANWQAIQSRHRDRIRVLEIDESGRIWIGSPNEFGYFEPGRDGNLEYRSLSDELPEERRNFAETRGVFLLGDRVYFQTLNRLFLWQDETLTELESWGEVFRYGLIHRGRFLVATASHLFDLTDFPETGTRPEPLPWVKFPESANLSFLSSWPDGRILMGTTNAGLFWVSESGLAPLVTPDSVNESWPYKAIRGPDGSILLGSVYSGLFRLRPDGELIEQISRRSGLAVNDVTGLTLDHENGVWLAQAGAISRVDLFNGMRVYDADHGLAAVHDLMVWENEWLLAGDHGLGLLRASGSDQSRLDVIDSALLQAFAVEPDDEHVLVAGSGGVYRVRIDAEGLQLLEQERLINDNYAFGLVPSRLQPAIYAELESGLGVLFQSDQGWQIQSRVEGVLHRILTVAEDRQGRVWAGTVAGRYYRLRWEGQTLVLDQVLDAEAGVPEGYAWAFDVDERLVLGTSDGGYRPVEPEGVRIEPDPDFANDQLGAPRGVYRLWAGDNGALVGGIGPGGALWQGSLNERDQFQWRERFLTWLEPGVNWFIQQHDDQLWIGRHPGIIRADWPPSAIDAATSRLQVFRVGYSDQEDWLPVSRDGGLSLGVLPSRAESLRFEFGLPRYSSPKETDYRVRLAGLESDWSPWSKESLRYYSSLPGGDYRFRVQARDAAGQVFDAEALAFRISHPWYLSTGAWLLYGIVAAALLYLTARFGYRSRERRLQLQKKALAQEVAEQTATVRAQAREIREISDARAQFFANVSHELRTPLTLIRGPLEELARRSGDELGSEDRQFLDVALRNSESMQALIGQVLDLQRLEADRMPLRLESVDMVTVVRGVVQRFQIEAELRTIELDLDMAADTLPWVCDPTHIDTMLANLLSNAIKFTPEKGRVTVALAERDRALGLSVSDTGPGIEPDKQETIFQRYRQGDQTDARSPGTGLGLALVRELAALHGGTATVASKPGQGSAFHILLPAGLQADRRLDLPTQHTEQAVPTATERFDFSDPARNLEDRPCVLLVDDNPELRAFLRFRLGQSYRIEEAEDGVAGLERARELVPDVIIADGLMPGMDGLAMTRALKGDAETDFIPVLMLTSRATSADAVAGLEAGADDYLAK